MPFTLGGGDLPQEMGELKPTVRENVDAGTDVIDLNSMRAQLEAARGRPKGG